MNRTALYYPSISIPTGTWLRRALLYWDQVASILPDPLKDDPSFVTPDMQFLKNEGVFRGIPPDSLLASGKYEVMDEFIHEVDSRVRAPSFQALINRSGRLRDFRIHAHKLADDVFLGRYLDEEDLDLARYIDRDWFLVERNTALLYLSCLAKYISIIDVEFTTPSTDLLEYEDYAFETTGKEDGVACLAVRLNGMLPVPRSDVPLEDILDFKRRRHDELMGFRMILDSIDADLRKTKDANEIKEAMMRFSDIWKKGVQDIDALLRDYRLASVVGSLKTIASIKSPTLWTALGVTAGHAVEVAKLPMTWSLVGIAILGTIEISSHLVDARNKRRATLRESPFAYLYHMAEESLT